MMKKCRIQQKSSKIRVYFLPTSITLVLSANAPLLFCTAISNFFRSSGFIKLETTPEPRGRSDLGDAMSALVPAFCTVPDCLCGVAVPLFGCGVGDSVFFLGGTTGDDLPS